MLQPEAPVEEFKKLEINEAEDLSTKSSSSNKESEVEITKEESKSDQEGINATTFQESTFQEKILASDNKTLIKPSQELKLIDGLLNYDNHPDVDPNAEPHLLFIVHGIGANQSHLVNLLKNFRESINTVRKIKKGQFKNPIILKVIDWKTQLTLEVKQKIEKITLKTNQKQRTQINEIPLDALFYLTSDHATTILKEVSSQANYFYEELKKAHPKLKVSIVAHSLGTVICYDLITCRYRNVTYLSGSNKVEPFKFPILNLFNLGSPLGLLLTMTDGEIKVLDKEGLCSGFYNIFHPNDLIAYRIEPLIPDYPNLNPDGLPYIKNDGSKNHTKKKIVKDTIEDIKEMAMLANSNFTLKRYDYVLQESYYENIFETMAIIRGHFAYWGNQDLFYFILTKVHSGSNQGFYSKL
jgi:DDHD domain/Putative serine esterase (DUF676)